MRTDILFRTLIILFAVLSIFLGNHVFTAIMLILLVSYFIFLYKRRSRQN